ncbi:class I SAM-dependent methyltransferase [Shinella sp. CPCC 100929]|uniref:Class I SAM-dependent methyltransferase n=1 Tax=Shinella lacus TaxID=2654216 RepID=A0ABT1R2I1_9HYPH|nr:class I SAM-dependent methyltransferase [Shinella lacus]MCQ4629371.1 class I SAM-dependent methyltransferase [Shinella lacus]
MFPEFQSFLASRRQEIAHNEEGEFRETSEPDTSLASAKIMEQLGIARQPGITAHDQLSKWLLAASQAEREEAGLGLPIPASPVHFIPGQYNIYYDFKNTDIALDELQKAGVDIKGTLLDFGCSSGRNLAVLQKAFGEQLDLFGVDPATASIEWVNRHIPGVVAKVSLQEPPLPFDDGMFDLIIAKSIWTHFSEAAGKRWFSEMRRVMKKGGHFLFSVHGPHDIASRIIKDVPLPKYERFAGHEKWTRDTFLLDLVKTYERDGFYFQPFKQVGNQGDLRLIEDAVTDDWGLTFISPEYLRSMLPDDISIIQRSIGRTGNRHDVYVVRRD